MCLQKEGKALYFLMSELKSNFDSAYKRRDSLYKSTDIDPITWYLNSEVPLFIVMCETKWFLKYYFNSIFQVRNLHFFSLGLISLLLESVGTLIWEEGICVPSYTAAVPWAVYITLAPWTQEFIDTH